MRQLLQDCLDPDEVEGTADVVALVHGCVEAISVRHDVELVVELPTAELEGNHQVLQRALNNMLDNAIRASRAADRVIAHVYGLDDHVVIEVSDKGAGFGRIDSGRGLGMVSVADALTSFNGSLEIHSGPEPGTTVRLMLPWCRS
jgi:signal transduction histidine kinase